MTGGRAPIILPAARYRSEISSVKRWKWCGMTNTLFLSGISSEGLDSTAHCFCAVLLTVDYDNIAGEVCQEFCTPGTRLAPPDVFLQAAMIRSAAWRAKLDLSVLCSLFKHSRCCLFFHFCQQFLHALLTSLIRQRPSFATARRNCFTTRRGTPSAGNRMESPCFFCGNAVISF